MLYNTCKKWIKINSISQTNLSNKRCNDFFCTMTTIITCQKLVWTSSKCSWGSWIQLHNPPLPFIHCLSRITSIHYLPKSTKIRLTDPMLNLQDHPGRMALPPSRIFILAKSTTGRPTWALGNKPFAKNCYLYITWFTLHCPSEILIATLTTSYHENWQAW